MNLVARVKALVLAPKTEWPVIDVEPASIASLYTGYIMPLAAIPAIAGFIGMTVLGYNILGTTVRYSMGNGIEHAVTQYLLYLAMPYVLALVIDAMALSFGGQRNRIQALKVAAYSSTALWVAGIFTILPALAVLSTLGVYSLYLLYLGLPVLMKSPPEQDKTIAYSGIVIVCAIIVLLVCQNIVSRIVPMPGVGQFAP